MAHVIMWHVAAAAAERRRAHCVVETKNYDKKTTSDSKQMGTEWEGKRGREWRGSFLTFWKLEWVPSIQNVRATCSFCEIPWKIQSITGFSWDGEMQMSERTAITTTPEQLLWFLKVFFNRSLGCQQVQELYSLNSLGQRAKMCNKCCLYSVTRFRFTF